MSVDLNIIFGHNLDSDRTANLPTLIGIGAPAKPFRIALNSLIIKERLGVSDRETVEQIK
jgi:hypothetical protein